MAALFADEAVVGAVIDGVSNAGARVLFRKLTHLDVMLLTRPKDLLVQHLWAVTLVAVDDGDDHASPLMPWAASMARAKRMDSPPD